MSEKTIPYIRAFLYSQEAFNHASDRKEALKVLRGAEQRMFSALQSVILKKEEDKESIPCLLLIDICLS